MKALNLFGLVWEIVSPSRLEINEAACQTAIFYDGCDWRVEFDYEPVPELFTSRDEAAKTVAEAVNVWNMKGAPDVLPI